MKNIVVLTIFFSLLFVQTLAQSGTLDMSFNGSGFNTASFFSSLHSAGVQREGKIVAGGEGENFLLTRFLSNGVVDSSFGYNGIITNSLQDYFQSINKIIILPDDRILTLATGTKSGNLQDIVIGKYNSDGTPDAGFGENGFIIQDLGFQEQPQNMIVQKDGSFIISGTYVENISQSKIKIFTARFKQDGSLDKTYGNGGFGSFSAFTNPDSKGLAIQPDGKIVVSVKSNSTPYYLGLFRFAADGKPDTSFGNNGLLVTNIEGSSNEYINSINVQSDGKIIGVGMARFTGFFYNGQVLIVRFNSDGSIDESFGENGIVYYSFDDKYNSEGLKVILQKNDKILIGGIQFNTPKQSDFSDFAFLRLMTDGRVDSSFGSSGKQVTDFGGYDYLFDMILQNDGRIVSVGEKEGDYLYIIARYLGDPAHPLITRIKRWIQNHTLHFQNLNEDENIAYYIVEESINQTSGFVPVAKVAAGQKDYSYSISSWNTASCYKVKIVNKDNSFVYTQPVSTTNSDEVQTSSSLSISPNPVSDYLNLSGLKEDIMYEIKILSKDGNQVSSVSGYRSEVKHISTALLNAGLYFLVVRDNKGIIKSMKFVKK